MMPSRGRWCADWSPCLDDSRPLCTRSVAEGTVVQSFGRSVLISSSHFKLAQRGGWRKLAHEDWRVWAIKIQGISDFSKNNTCKQYVMMLTSKLIEVSMIFGYPDHFHRCRHPPAEPRGRLDREGSEHIPSFARRSSAEQRPAL